MGEAEGLYVRFDIGQLEISEWSLDVQLEHLRPLGDVGVGDCHAQALALWELAFYCFGNTVFSPSLLRRRLCLHTLL